MRTSTFVKSMLSAWFMAIIYYQVEVETGIELKPLLCASVITMAVGLYLGCRNDKETTEEEA